MLGGGAVTAVSRVVVVVVVSGELAQETSIMANTENTEVRMISFFIVGIMDSKKVREKSLPQMYESKKFTTQRWALRARPNWKHRLHRSSP